MDIYKFILMVVIGGLIGYITNKVAIKMLFRPINPIKIGPFTLQGVFPRRKDQMAISLADTIETELLSKDTIINALTGDSNIDDMKQDVKDMLVVKIVEAIPPMAKMFLGDNIDTMIRNLVDKEGDKIFDDIVDKFKEEATKNLDIRKLVKDRIDALDFVEFEKIIFGLMSRELRHIEVIGLILGGLIGVVQYFITLI
jgi:uncharacterized membrane protein YheB (UPF0754 family)